MPTKKNSEKKRKNNKELKNEIKEDVVLVLGRKLDDRVEIMHQKRKRIRWRDVCDDTEHKHHATKLEHHDTKPEYHDNGNVTKTKV